MLNDAKLLINYKKMKDINPWKYSVQLIKKAQKMRKQGYACTTIRDYLGFDSITPVYYYTSPGRREDRALCTHRWRMTHREQDLKYKRAYSLEYSRRKRLLAKKLKRAKAK